MKYLFYLSILLLISYNARSQPPFYIQTCDNITKVEDADPEKITAVKWIVRLYRKDLPATGNTFWGTISGTSASEVMDKLQSQQNFELRSNAFFGKGYVQDNIYTHFNPLGPIALLGDCNNQPSITEKLNEDVSTISDKAADYLDAYTEVKRKLDIILKGKPSTAFDNLGKVFKEYTDNLKSAIAQVLSLKKLLNSSSQQSMNEIKQSLADIDNKLTIAANKAQIILNKTKQIENEKINNERLHGNYMFFIAEALVPGDEVSSSGIRPNKRWDFISDPVPFTGGFQGNDDIKERRDFVAAVQKIWPDFKINDINFSAYGFYALNSNFTACQNAIEEKKRNISDGWGGNPKAFEIFNIQMNYSGDPAFQDKPIPTKRADEDEIDYKVKIHNLGVAYHNGEGGVLKNDKKALECFKISATTGSGWVPSMVVVGSFYYEGLGTPKNYWEALKWFTKSKEMNGSMYYLGLMYEKGQVVEKDMQKSMDWYMKAALNGNATAASMFTTFKMEARIVTDGNSNAREYTLVLPGTRRTLDIPWLRDYDKGDKDFYIDRTTYDIYQGPHVYGLSVDGTIRTFYLLKIKDGNGKKYVKFRFLNSKSEVKESCFDCSWPGADCSLLTEGNFNLIDLTK